MLVTKDFKTLKICDFGEARILENTMTDKRGTPYTMAPEVCKFKIYKMYIIYQSTLFLTHKKKVYQGGHYNEKADIYSLGITMWQLIARTMPYQEYRKYQMQLMDDVITLREHEHK